MPKFKYSTILLISALFLFGCSEVQLKTVEEKYDKAILYIEKGDYGLAPPLLHEIIRESPGTRYATFAYLKLGDAMLASGESKATLDQAEVNYRFFLKQNPNHHLVPYVLSRLIELNYKRNVSSIWGDSYAFARDSGHFKTIILDYQRFYLLYPHSLYMIEGKEYRDKSITALAEHELVVGDWYYDHTHYPSAISRYRYILTNYPNFPRRDQVIEKLVIAYDKNQQPHKAEELRVLLQNGLTAQNP